MMNIGKLIASCGLTCVAVLALGVSSARADVTLEKDETWTDGRALSGTIDLAGHNLTVSSLTGNATITSSADGGYELLEYIENDGKAYVNTDLLVANNTVIDIKLQLLKDPGNAWVSYVGARDENSRSGQFGGWFYKMNHYKGVTETEDTLTAFPAALNTDYLVHLDKAGSCTIDGVEFATGNNIGNDMPITVFAMNQKAGVNFIGSFRVYSCRILYGTAVQCDLRPARRLSDGALGLLDVKDAAKPVFYANANSVGAFTAGPVVSNEFAHPAELHVAVANGWTENTTVTIAGPVRVVKEGAGTFVATKVNQTYTGGTDVKAGTFRCGNLGDSYIYGAAGSTVTVREGATFDFDGFCRHYKHPFALDGGTVKSDTFRGDNHAASAWLLGMTLTKDSFLHGRDFGFVGASWAEIPLQMNGHRLTVDVTESRYIFAANLKVEGGGEIYMRTGGWLALGGNPTGGKYVKAETTTLRMSGAAIYDAGGEHVFGSYISEITGGWDGANTVIKVLNRFVPGTEWHATELQDGATLDLSAYTDAWNVTCTLAHSGAKTATATFAANATIKLDLGTRVPENEMKLVGWTDADAPLSSVKFKLPDTISSDDFMLERRSNGLYVMAAVKKATWTGAVSGDCTNPANWTCYDANDNVIAGARPGSITDVTVSGAVQLDIPANSFSCASFTCVDVSLKGDCDWSGLGQPMEGPIDLAGHKLTTSSLTGDATIANTADGGYELLEYIENDGKAYVNTGVPVAANTVIDIRLQLLKSPGNWWVSYVGARDDGSRNGQFGGWFYGLNHYKGVTASEGNFATAALNTDYLVHLDKNGPCTINGGALFATGNGIGNDFKIMVFAINQNDVASFPGSFRVYSCRILYGTAVQRDLKPARRLSDGALGLVDVNAVNPVFYANANSAGAFTAGPVVSTELAHPAELHVVVADGQAENSTVAISGPVRLVKEGAGTFVATKQNQTYTGGTDIKAGTFRCGNTGNRHVYGLDLSTVTVREGATFDCNGYSNHDQFRFVLDGGTVKNEIEIGYKVSCWLVNVTLTKDSFLSGYNFGFVGPNWAESLLRMNGHTLTVDVSAGQQFYVGNLKVEGGGEIHMRTGGWFVLGGNPEGGKYVRAETTTLRMGGAAIRDAGGEHVFGSYVSEHVGGWDYHTVNPPGSIKVLNRFVPGTEWHAAELQDGATLDLSACTGAWNVTCDLVHSTYATATATFAEGATILVDLGTRKMKSSEQVVEWSEKPTNVRFQAISESAGKFVTKDDGLYWRVGFSIIVR